MIENISKRIVYFSDAPYVGGAERYLLLLAVGMKQRGYDTAFILNNVERLHELHSSLEREDIPICPSHLNLPYRISGIREFVKSLRNLHADIFHINLPGPYDSQYSLVAPLARLAGVKRIVSTEHLPMVGSFLKGRVLKGIGSRWVDIVITVSKDNVKHLELNHGIMEGKIRVVYLGVKDNMEKSGDIKRELGIDDGSRLIIMVGSIERRKGHSTAIEAMKRLGEGIHLLIVGKGPNEGILRKMVDRAGLADRVHFLGSRDDVPSILSQSDLLVLPSTLEATPYVVIEAMAAQLPVIASNIYGIGELVEDGRTGLLVPPDDSEVLADSILKILGDERLMSTMGSEGRKRYLENFTFDRFVDETAAIYDELLTK